MKLWAGRFSKEADKKTNDFNSSIKTDSRMFNEDIDGSIAHASMLAAKGIISEEDCKKILAGLSDIRNDIISGEPRRRGYPHFYRRRAYLENRRCGQKTPHRAQQKRPGCR